MIWLTVACVLVAEAVALVITCAFFRAGAVQDEQRLAAFEEWRRRQRFEQWRESQRRRV